jgi:hypothetical protein
MHVVASDAHTTLPGFCRIFLHPLHTHAALNQVSCRGNSLPSGSTQPACLTEANYHVPADCSMYRG